jgi:hypothetical protein
MPRTRAEFPIPETSLSRRTDEVGRVATSNAEGDVDADFSETILQEEGRRLNNIVRRYAPKILSKAFEQLSPQDRDDEEKVRTAMRMAMNRFLREVEAGKFNYWQ